MAMDKIVKPDEYEFMSPVVSFAKFKEAALMQRDRLRDAFSLEALAEFNPNDATESQGTQNTDQTSSKSEYSDPSNQLLRGKLHELFSFKDDEALDAISVFDLSNLAVLNKRDILFRPKVEQEDVPADTKLETLRQREMEKKKRREIIYNIKYGNTILKYADYNVNDLKHHRIDGHRSSVVNDMAVTLVICKPQNKVMEGSERRNASLRPYWRFLLRGDTTLLELHSLFRCSSDYGTSVDEEEIPQIHDFFMFKYPSSFIFIHDTFYIADTYVASNETLSQLDSSKLQPHIDISEPIRNWMKRRKNQFGPTQVKSVTEGRISDLTCRLGYPYVYVHQGNCEHVFFFTDLRLIDVHDHLHDFPQKLSDTSVENYCIACRRRIAEWITECESFPISPAHMCDDCYKNFHYILRYRRNVDSKAYVYMDPSILQY